MTAFGGANLKSIAEKMGVNYHTLRNWAKETRDIPPTALRKIAKMTNISLNWLLLEEGAPFMDIGKPFDLEYAVEHHNNWLDVIDEWYDFEGRSNPMPDTLGASFMSGWSSFTKAQRLDAIRDFKNFLDLTFPQNADVIRQDQ